MTVVGAPYTSDADDIARGDKVVAVSSDVTGSFDDNGDDTGIGAQEVGGLLEITFAAEATGTDLTATVTVHVYPDDDAAREFVALTHTAVVGIRDAVTLANASVTVRVIDDETKGVTVTPTAVPLPCH